jgi:hypothetical protein
VEEEATRIPLEEDHADDQSKAEEGPPLQEGAASRSGRSFLCCIVLVGAIVAAAVALSVALAVAVSADDEATVLDKLDEQPVDVDRMVEGGNDLANVKISRIRDWLDEAHNLLMLLWLFPGVCFVESYPCLL